LFGGAILPVKEYAGRGHNYMCKRLLSLFETAKETTTTIRWLLGVVVVLGAIGIGFGEWLSHLNTISFVSFWVVIGALILMLGTLGLDWMRQRDIERIPDLVEKMDILTSNFVDDFTPQLSEGEWRNLYRDYSVILGLNLDNLMNVLPKDYNKTLLEREFENINRAYVRKLDPQKKTEESLIYLGDMGSILDTYNVGLGRLKATPQYQKLDKKIKSLQRKAPSAYISVKVNDYYTVSERLYTILLGVKPLYEQPMLRELLPAKIKAKKSQIRPMVDGQIANLISGVRESIVKYKERNEEQGQQKSKGNGKGK